MKVKQDFYVKTTVIVVSMLFLILAGKAVRYTIMKEVLVDMSIGHGMLGAINDEDSVINDEEVSADELDASRKSARLFKNINIFKV